MPKCAVPILLGLDVCQSLEAKISYRSESFTFTYGSSKFRLQLLSKENLIGSQNMYSESESSGEEAVPLLYSSVNAELSDEGIPDINEQFDEPDAINMSSDLDEMEKKELIKLLGSYEAAFATDFGDLNQIKGAEFHINVKSDVLPFSSRLRRRVDECLDSLSKKSYFTTLDLMTGYWQIPVDPKSRKYTAFIAPTGIARQYSKVYY
ncbi:Transposon Ty3-I Gag-Pol polyprotein [Smittium culicis]|uniref:Transposon Ty3-I Gag-Pol polyprotein n=1 Tax=Smittium culicis TaxID=133412 RepID=A0A1R1XUH4_9FUNG|nr:Transposon Ty3-I Gag-Pol polyprotein [Smittium culicis]